MECYLCDSEAKWFTVNTDMQVKPVFWATEVQPVMRL
jgi:hypothetical protein